MSQTKNYFHLGAKVLILCLFLSPLLFSNQKEREEAALVLAHLRGNYCHPGNQEAVELVLKKILEINPHLKKGHYLDVGCGKGATMDFMASSGFSGVTGFDLDPSSIAHAKLAYPQLSFDNGDVTDKQFSNKIKPFSCATMFTVFTLIKNKRAALENLAKAAEDGALLVVFDYAHGAGSVLKKFGELKVYPLDGSEEGLLKETGWELIFKQDLTKKFITWYKDFLVKFEFERANLLAQGFSEAIIDKAKSPFLDILDILQRGTFKGSFLIAKRVKKI